MTTTLHRIAWITNGSATVRVTDANTFVEVARFEMSQPYIDSGEPDQPAEEMLTQFHGAITAHYGSEGWRNHGEALHDDLQGTVGLDFDEISN